MSVPFLLIIKVSFAPGSISISDRVGSSVPRTALNVLRSSFSSVSLVLRDDDISG